MGLGTAPLASIMWNNDEATALATVARAVEAGLTYFDTAPLYGLGQSESRLGKALATHDGVIATKVGRLLLTAADGSTDIRFDFSYDATLRSLEGSLLRLDVDRVDVVHIHDPDDHVEEALAGTYPALVRLRDEGVISAVSVGTNTVATASIFLERADLDCLMVAGRYTLLDQSASNLIIRCAERGVAYIAAGVFNSGVLARPTPGAWLDYAPVSDHLLARVREIEQVCLGYDTSLVAAALAFPLRNEGVQMIVVGMATPEEVDNNLQAFRAGAPDDLWLELDDQGLISDRVGAGGPA
jgi:D-threo-aldose 1-dehydrogenase